MKPYDDSKPTRCITYSLHGYVLNVDLEYPDKLHELHNDYPLASEKLKIDRSNIANQHIA